MSLHRQESNGDWEDPEPQLQAIPTSNQGFGGQKVTVVCASFQIMSLSALWSPQLGSTLGTGEKVTPAFWGCIGKRGALGLCHRGEVTMPSPGPFFGTQPPSSPHGVPRSWGHPALQGPRVAATGGAPIGASQVCLPQLLVLVP